MEKSLNPMQQKIVTIAANTATGNLDALRTELNAGLDAGLTINQIKEILMQIYAYAGFPPEPARYQYVHVCTRPTQEPGYQRPRRRRGIPYNRYQG